MFTGLYRVFLRLLPRDRRARFGEEMTMVFADQRARTSMLEAPALWMTEISGLAGFSLREWRERRRARSAARGRSPQWPWQTELRSGWRGLRSRGWRAAFVGVLLAVTLAANAVVFAAADAFVFRAAPYADAGRLAVIQRHTGAVGVLDYLPVPVVRAWDQHRDLFAGVEAHQRDASAYLTIGGVTEIVRTEQITPGVLALLGVMPQWGRPFTDADRNSTSIAIISAALAARAFARPETAVGQRLPMLNGDRTVIGVMPASFRFPTALEEVWVPMDLDRIAQRTNVRNIARLAREHSIATASPAFAARAAAVGLVAPRQPFEPMTLRAMSDARRHTGAAPVFAMLIGGAACLLLIACANVASLELAEAARRARAHAVQVALGASRAALRRVVVLESALLMSASVVAAAALATWGVSALGDFLTPSMRAALVNPLDLDGRAWTALAVAAAAAWLLTSWPLMRIGTRPLADALRDDVRVMPVTRRAARSRQFLMAGQIALTVLLLVGGLLYLRTHVARLGIDRGFETSGLATIEVFPPPGSVAHPPALEAEILARLRATPGVVSVSRTAMLPPSTTAGVTGQIHVDGRPTGEGRAMLAHFSIDPEYFATVGVPIVEGRALEAASAPEEVVVDEGFARRFWPGTSALGHTFSVAGTRMGNISEFRIVGLSRGFRADRSTTDNGENVYALYVRLSPTFSPLRFVARLDDPRRVSALGALVRGIAPQAVVRTETIDERYARLDGETRLAAAIATGFAVLALVVATAGVYAVMAFLVSGRSREIGIRMALGADRGGVQRLVLASSLRVVAGGAAVGVIAAILSAKALESQLFGVSPTDPATYVVVASVVVGTALVATWRPARRASRLDPAATLRTQ